MWQKRLMKSFLLLIEPELMEVSQLIRPWIIITLGRLISGCLYKCVHLLYINYTLTWLTARFGCHIMVKKKNEYVMKKVTLSYDIRKYK